MPGKILNFWIYFRKSITKVIIKVKNNGKRKIFFLVIEAYGKPNNLKNGDLEKNLLDSYHSPA